MTHAEQDVLNSFVARHPDTALRLYRECQAGEARCDARGLNHVADHYRRERRAVREVVRRVQRQRREFRTQRPAGREV